jgi:hypothetical protein
MYKKRHDRIIKIVYFLNHFVKKDDDGVYTTTKKEIALGIGLKYTNSTCKEARYISQDLIFVFNEKIKRIAHENLIKYVIY